MNHELHHRRDGNVIFCLLRWGIWFCMLVPCPLWENATDMMLQWACVGSSLCRVKSVCFTLRGHIMGFPCVSWFTSSPIYFTLRLTGFYNPCCMDLRCFPLMHLRKQPVVFLQGVRIRLQLEAQWEEIKSNCTQQKCNVRECNNEFHWLLTVQSAGWF